tara:strand:+ start:29281 stop:29670 length:390 start_codon:yes stop_codon:yes gene_type:complete
MSGSDLTISGIVPPTGNVAKLTPAATVKERQEATESGNVSPQQAQEQVTRDAVVSAVSDISDYIQNVSRELQFKVDDQTGNTVITVLDSETGDVIRQIPQEEVVRLARYLAENSPDPITGLLINSEGFK